MKPSRLAESFAIGKCTSSQVFSESAWMHRSTVGLKRCGHHTLEPTPHPETVTTTIIPFLVGNPYKPSFVTVTGLGVDRDHTIDGQNFHLGCGNSCISTDQLLSDFIHQYLCHFSCFVGVAFFWVKVYSEHVPSFRVCSWIEDTDDDLMARSFYGLLQQQSAVVTFLVGSHFEDIFGWKWQFKLLQPFILPFLMSFWGFSRSLLQSYWDQISLMLSSSWTMSLPTNQNDYYLNGIIQNSAPENPAGINNIKIHQRQFGVDSLVCHFWPQLRYTIPAASTGAYLEASCYSILFSYKWEMTRCHNGDGCVFSPNLWEFG